MFTWARVKAVFVICIVVWLGGIGLRLLAAKESSAYDKILLLNFSSLTAPFEVIGILAGLALGARWFYQKFAQHPPRKLAAEPRGDRRPKSNSAHALSSPQSPSGPASERWEALVTYDDDIRRAADALRPFGEHWVQELGSTFTALNEDRQYLPNIVRELRMRAQRAKAEIERRTSRFAWTADGEQCSESSFRILREAEARGFILEVDARRTFVVTKGTSISYLRSNYDIERFGEWLERT